MKKFCLTYLKKKYTQHGHPGRVIQTGIWSRLIYNREILGTRVNECDVNVCAVYVLRNVCVHVFMCVMHGACVRYE